MNSDTIFGLFMGFLVMSVVGLIGYAVYDSVYGYHGPSQEEIQNLQNALPEGCKSHDIGSYGKIDNLVIIECDGRKVSASYTYMYESHGKSSETDRAATYVIQ